MSAVCEVVGLRAYFVPLSIKCLHDVSMRQQAALATPVSAYLPRVAAECALPTVDVTTETEGQGEAQADKTSEAVRGFVLSGLTKQLFMELWRAFTANGGTPRQGRERHWRSAESGGGHCTKR